MSSLSPYFKALYGLVSALEGLSEDGAGAIRIVPRAVAERRVEGLYVAWPEEDYLALKAAWTSLTTLQEDMIPWPLGDGFAVGGLLDAQRAEHPEDVEKTKLALLALPTVDQARRTLQAGLRKLDSWYEVRSRLHYLPWLAGIGAVTILIGLLWRNHKSSTDVGRLKP